MELTPFVLALLKWILIIIILVVGVFFLNRTRNFARGTSGKNMSFRKRKESTSAEIRLHKNRRFNPAFIEMVVTNTGTTDIDLNAPVIVFKRWFTKRKFRVLKVEHSEIYPIYLERGKTSVLDISLEQFYDGVPELQLACRMSVEMKDLHGKRFKSPTIRLKWF